MAKKKKMTRAQYNKFCAAIRADNRLEGITYEMMTEMVNENLEMGGFDGGDDSFSEAVEYLRSIGVTAFAERIGGDCTD